jgi:chemotaxis protein histidine kinase CheA
VAGVAGASILGNGRVSLILDVSAIVERASQTVPAEFAG